MIRHLMVPITAAMISMGAVGAYAQSAFPAPLPNQAASSSAFPPVNGSAPTASVGTAPQSSFPVNGAAPVGGAGAFSAAPPTQAPGEDCMKAFIPLREEAEKRGKAIKAASDRHAPPDEACKLIRNFGQAEMKMIKYVETNAAKCGIPPQVGAQMKDGHKNTEAMTTKVCNVAQQMQNQPRGPAGPSLSEVLGSGSAPEANAGKKGGSTFDTLNGNVLTR
ncbi:hypothetical protein LUI11_25675 [Bradyrhizobium diazoefficiens]|jgi:hypothetical protein|uniref:Bll7522 protein n=2 Tax=Bradyrhizobium diazoefficiens TaxID=1355477 RepID=A0A837C4J7_9BRAD|nr:hypothetical protein [Bradyrhizobium diazoefficiens]APO56500.1 hypothetical protein BD122_39430 [Bradyrhizobium diazoefficiens]KGJ63905.1 hypothetical protein BJA5080_05704 [Bradyrhizobium diazoefficiens SEMIA 5080]KOY05995.1 hypothetical protein AF336_33270 [Bradyrhizobium diazoefficiens]MCD9295457.1 hypothetical protein [Bradyrhizobium diazoefficiens]MCD9813830.1 hypothetical protein [Bradyrhizobium diazoefficiens]